MRRVARQMALDGVLLVLALAAGLLVLVAKRNPSVTGQAESAAALFPSLSDSQPHRLTLTRDGQDAHLFNRASSPDSSDWVVESPWKRTADTATIDAAIAALRDIRLVRKLGGVPQVSPAGLRTLGLDRPQCAWHVEIDGAHWTLELGAPAPPPRGGTYVAVSGPTTPTRQFYVVSGDSSKLFLQPEQLLEPRLLPFVPSEFRELAIETEHWQAKYSFDGSRGRWFEADGQRRRISRELIDRVLFDLSNLKGEHFLTPASALSKSLFRKQATITLRVDKDPSTIQLALLGGCEGQPALSVLSVTGTQDVTACANVQDLQARLDAGGPAWVDRHLFSLRMDEVERLAMQVDGRLLELERYESRFRVLGNDPRAIDINTGNDALQALVSIQGTLQEGTHKPVSSQMAETNFIELRSLVATSANNLEERVLVGPATPNGERWVRRMSDSALLEVDATNARSLVADDNWTRSKILVNSDASAVQSIEFVVRGRTFRWTQDDQALKHAQPAKALPLDSNEIEKLRGCLGKLRVQGWLYPDAARVDRSTAATLIFETNDGDRSPRRYTLELALGDKRRLVAKLVGADAFFDPEPALTELLQRILR
jgi:hypothetical protein